MIVGGPPCQPFSRAGRSLLRNLIASGRRDEFDARRELWKSFLEIVESPDPRDRHHGERPGTRARRQRGDPPDASSPDSKGPVTALPHESSRPRSTASRSSASEPSSWDWRTRRYEWPTPVTLLPPPPRHQGSSADRAGWNRLVSTRRTSTMPRSANAADAVAARPAWRIGDRSRPRPRDPCRAGGRPRDLPVDGLDDEVLGHRRLAEAVSRRHLRRQVQAARLGQAVSQYHRPPGQGRLLVHPP